MSLSLNMEYDLQKMKYKGSLRRVVQSLRPGCQRPVQFRLRTVQYRGIFDI
jgi:hypothetical protein